MKKKKIKIAGKPVTLAYCYATEIIYKDYSGEDISTFISEAIKGLSETPQKMPDVKKTIYLVLAAAMAYSNSRDTDCPIVDTDLMNKATPQELGTAVGTIIGLYSQFYTLPEGEAKEEKGDTGKNS